jgi:Alpha/beta hydrolase domain
MTGHGETPNVIAMPGPPLLLLSSFDLAPLGYTTQEFFISGTALSYKLPGAPTVDGRWDAVPAETAPFATRVVVARPTDPHRFNGAIAVEWLNVSAGTDGAPDWNALHRELMREGYAYMAVSAQKVGVEGGWSLTGVGVPLKKADPERYGHLSHPGDAFSYDIFSQAGSLLRSDASKILGPLAAKHIIAVGESQSAAFLTTYANAVDPLAKVYDGFLIHSRFGSAASLENASMIGSTGQQGAVKLRTDLRAPVITVITETDLFDSRIPGFHGARQPDNDRLRIWEIAGTAHADNYIFTLGVIDSGSSPLEQLAAGYEPTAKIFGTDLDKPMNNAPQHHYVVEAALSNLDRWIRTGQAPPEASPIKLSEGGYPGAPINLVLDTNGLAEGGVRTPWVDVPTARLSGVGNSGGPLGFLVGVCEPFDAATLGRLYPGGKSEYLKKFEASLDSAIKSGFILPADRQEILVLAAIAYRGSR